MFDILSIIPGRKKLRSKGWYSFNAVCCHHRGHKPDRRGRAGIKFENHYSWRYHCFNCNYNCHFTLGKSINTKARQLLGWSGIDEQQISSWNIESLRQRDFVDAILPPEPKSFNVSFKPCALPDNAVLINTSNPKHRPFINYLQRRGFKHTDYAFMVTPGDEGRFANRIIIPYTYKNEIVGHTSRFCDVQTPKYINEQSPGYIFGIDLQQPEWQYCLLMEGIFDALSIHGCAYMHNTISVEQARTLSLLNRRIIVVPDQDTAGLSVTDRALELGYNVSIPDWGPGVKDVNEAVIKWGKLATVLSIIDAATSSKVKIKLRKQKLL